MRDVNPGPTDAACGICTHRVAKGAALVCGAICVFAVQPRVPVGLWGRGALSGCHGGLRAVPPPASLPAVRQQVPDRPGERRSAISASVDLMTETDSASETVRRELKIVVNGRVVARHACVSAD
jgi:hypothetical protein